MLGCCANVELRSPCAHFEMLQLMRSSDLILSDSGGLQEEARLSEFHFLFFETKPSARKAFSAGTRSSREETPTRSWQPSTGCSPTPVLWQQ